MPSSMSKRISRAFSISSRSSRRNSSSTFDSQSSTTSDANALLDVEFPNASFSQSFAVIQEDDVLDSEDQAWGSPPPTNFIPAFLRRQKN